MPPHHRRPLRPPTPEAADLARTTQDYFVFGEHSARLDYPRFVALQLPIGSGAIESLCKNLVEQRAKGAGMRWTAAGVQAIVSLRAVQRSGRWTDFWARQPLRAYQQRWPRKQRARAPRPPAPPMPAMTPSPPTPVLHLPSAAWRNGPAILPRRSAYCAFVTNPGYTRAKRGAPRTPSCLDGQP